MKTTIEIADGLLEEAKKTARRDAITLRQLVEEGLGMSLEKRRQTDGFRLRRASYRGAGLQSGIREGHWKDLRDLSYQGRGT